MRGADRQGSWKGGRRTRAGRGVRVCDGKGKHVMDKSR